MENLEDWKKAGKIAAEVLEYGKGLIKKDAKLLEVVNKIENKIFEFNAKPAFPVQISINEIAAHFCPEEDDIIVFTDQLVSLDVGVEVNGAIGDTAATVDLTGENNDLVKASRRALEEATKVIKIGVKLNEIGRIIEEEIKSYGFEPIRNLSGHGLNLYNIHSSPTIPNYDNKDETKLEKGMTIAIEPFATNGSGLIHEKGTATIFSMLQRKAVRIGFVKQILQQIDRYNNLPFTKRWLTNIFSSAQVNFALKQLKDLRIIREYPPLVERANGLVSQAENSFYIDDEVLVLTKIN
jgi:methionyl aminopeptidase